MTTAFIMRLFIFILLGAQVDFGLMSQYWAGGVVVVLILMLVARPVTVFACALPDRRARWSFNEMLFMCWTRETGVIPAALAGLLLGMKAPGAQRDRLGHLHRHPDDDPDPGADHEMAGQAPGLVGVEEQGANHGRQYPFQQSEDLGQAAGLQLRGRGDRAEPVIFLAGQLGLERDNKLVGAPGDFRAQAMQAFENLKLALADAGARSRTW